MICLQSVRSVLKILLKEAIILLRMLIVPMVMQQTKGYDAVYGLGLPNFGQMYEYVKNMKN